MTEQDRTALVTELGERLGALRLCDADALDAMQRSLARRGQLTPLVAFEEHGRLEIIDGFKRLRAARALGWSAVAVAVVDVQTVEAKLRLAHLHQQCGLTELEEGWLVRSLYREDRLSQPEIARRLDRHKSWVCRRLLLVEALDTAVQGDVRLGLLAPRAAVALGALPRGNQHGAAGVVIQKGLTVRQTELWVAQLLELSGDGARASAIERRLQEGIPVSPPEPRRAARSEADWMAADIAALRRVAGRLQARLWGTPLVTLEMPAADVVRQGLMELELVLAALGQTLSAVLRKELAG